MCACVCERESVCLCAAGDVQSEHHLVVCKVKVKRGWAPPRPRGEVREVVGVERLKNAGCKEEFESGLKEEWLVHKERVVGNVEEEWMAFKNALIGVLLGREV